jgi:hypothetical protein
MEGLLHAAPVCDAAIVEVIVLAPEAEVGVNGDERYGRQPQCVLVDRGEVLGFLCAACKGKEAERGGQQSFHKAMCHNVENALQRYNFFRSLPIPLFLKAKKSMAKQETYRKKC